MGFLTHWSVCHNQYKVYVTKTESRKIPICEERIPGAENDFIQVVFQIYYNLNRWCSSKGRGTDWRQLAFNLVALSRPGLTFS